MDNFYNINCLHIPFCEKLNISEDKLIVGIEIIFLNTDFKNYFSIKSSAKKIKNFLSLNKYKIRDSKVLDAIAKCLKFKNLHHMKESTYPSQETLKETLVEDLHAIYDKVGLKGLLPQNLPDHILNSCSYEYQAYTEQNDNITVSGLFLIIMLFNIDNKEFDSRGSISFEMTPEELDMCFRSYGISIGLEELKRIGLISMPKKSLPTVDNVFDSNKERQVTLKK